MLLVRNSSLFPKFQWLSHTHTHTHTHTSVWQDKRISCLNALCHPFLDDGRIRFHTFLCSCCVTWLGSRQFCRELEPSCPFKFDPSYERELTSLNKAKCEWLLFTVFIWATMISNTLVFVILVQLHQYVCNAHPHQPSLFINRSSKHYQQFQRWEGRGTKEGEGGRKGEERERERERPIDKTILTQYFPFLLQLFSRCTPDSLIFTSFHPSPSLNSWCILCLIHTCENSEATDVKKVCLYIITLRVNFIKEKCCIITTVVVVL